MRAEIGYLRSLSDMNDDPRVRAEIQLLIVELERRIRESGNGHAAASQG